MKIEKKRSPILILSSIDFYREAVRQRKALSRTSSNILLNSIHLQSATNQLNPQQGSNIKSGDYDLRVTVKEVQLDTHSELSDLEVYFYDV